jgi:mono/diheme cytochrome c family protein
MIMKTFLVMFVIGVYALPALAGASGKGDFNAFCAGCHGANANVQTEKAKALKMDVKKLSLRSSTMNKKQMIAIIETGKGDMPEFKKQLTKARIAAIVDYIRSLK